jgi:hypothetical protein
LQNEIEEQLKGQRKEERQKQSPNGPNKGKKHKHKQRPKKGKIKINKEIQGQIYGYLDTKLFSYIMSWIHFIINLWMHNMKGFDR